LPPSQFEGVFFSEGLLFSDVGDLVEKATDALLELNDF
jgi:hypothetical protein